MMLTPKHTFRLRLMGTALAMATLSGCFLNPDALPPTETVWSHQFYHSLIRLQPAVVEPQVETVTLIHEVAFAFGEDALSAHETEQLTKFLQDSAADRRSRIRIDGPRKAAGKHDILTAARIANIAAKLSDMGIQSEVAPRPIDSLVKSDDAIVVALTRAMVIEPDCAVPKTIYGPRPTHIWTCTTAVALGRMVADPLDLERGRPQDPGDAEALSLGVERYRDGKVTPLTSQSTSSQ